MEEADGFKVDLVGTMNLFHYDFIKINIFYYMLVMIGMITSGRMLSLIIKWKRVN